MDWTKRIQNAVDYIEAHITEKLDLEEIARRAYSSTFHFLRTFGITCGLTVGEYIRKRRLTLAGKELLDKKTKVIDVAFRYGYETPESFARAFQKFHGIMPSQVKTDCILKSFPRLRVKADVIEANEMKYKIQEKPEKVLVGYKKRFTGAPYGKQRVEQEEAFLSSTRAKQWLLIGASCDYTTDYMVITNIDGDGYDFYVAYELDEWTRAQLFNPGVTGVDFMEQMNFEIIVIPRQTYVVFETEKKKRPIADYTEMRKKIVTEWLPSTEYVFASAPEVVAMHWRPKGEWEKERFIEICIPIEKTKR